MKSVQTILIIAVIASAIACGYSKHATTPPQPGAVPAISTLSPASATHGGGDFTLTVNGSSFNSNAVVNWNGAARTTTWVSAGQVTAAITAADISATGSATVTVTNPGTSGGTYGGGTMSETSNSMTFTIN
jgi:IPT/TIG domain-containing protein